MKNLRMAVANFSSEMIYADNAATTRLDEESLALMIELQRKFFANPSSEYKLARPLKEILKESRARIAACINAEPQEIFFTSGGTESDNWAIKSCVLENLRGRPNIITSAIEHKAILNSCAAMKKLGCSVTKLGVDGRGAVSVEELRRKIRPNTKIISVMLANNEVGTIEPIKSLAALAGEHGKIFHTDAVQAVGHIPVDVKELGIAMLSASAHKFNGPKGVGFLYVSAGLKISPYIDGGGQEFALRGLNVDFRLNGGEIRLPGHLSLSFKGNDGETLLHRLDLKNICVATGSACNSRRTEISHVLKALNVPKDYVRGTIRISFGKENTCDEAEIIGKNLVGLNLSGGSAN